MVRLKRNAKMVIFKDIWITIEDTLIQDEEAWVAIMDTAIVVNSKLSFLDRFFYKESCTISETTSNDLLYLKDGGFCYQLRFANSRTKGDFLEATCNPNPIVPCPSPVTSESLTSS